MPLGVPASVEPDSARLVASPFGALLIWLDLPMNWHGRASGKRGRSPTYSDEAIHFCLSIKCRFNLQLRQAMGMTHSLLQLENLDWTVTA